MLDYAAYLNAQRSTRDLARSALPAAPVVPSADQAPPRRRLRDGAAAARRPPAALLIAT